MAGKVTSKNIKTGEVIQAGSVGESKKLLETNAVNAPVKDILWEAQEAQTEGVRIVDPGVGKAVVLRHFLFKALPRPKWVPAPDKHQIVSQFKQAIEMSLWGDGLIIREDKQLEVHSLQKAKTISKSLYHKMLEEGADFCILCLAEPRQGVSVNDYIHKAT